MEQSGIFRTKRDAVHTYDHLHYCLGFGELIISPLIPKLL